MCVCVRETESERDRERRSVRERERERERKKKRIGEEFEIDYVTTTIYLVVLFFLSPFDLTFTTF